MSDAPQTVPLASIRPDEHNANAHTERGTYMLRKSLERFGFLEPGVLDANNNVVGGNNRLEAAADVLDAGEAVVIDIDGTRPVFVRRKDLDLNTPQGREAALALNRSALVGIEFDPAILGDYELSGVNLDDWFLAGELEEMQAAAQLTEIGEPGERRNLGDKNKQIKAVLYADQLALFEQAIKATGEKNRADALMTICGYYLENSEEGQLHATLQSLSAA